MIDNPYKSLVPSGTGLISVDDLMNDKILKVHNQMYENALSRFYEDHPEMEQGYITKEIPNKDWKSPSSVLFISEIYPFAKKKVSLKPWWDDAISFIRKKTESWSDVIIDEDSMKDAEITSIDYVNGNVSMRSKLTQNTWVVPFSKVDENTPLSDDDLTLRNTFSYKIQNG